MIITLEQLATIADFLEIQNSGFTLKMSIDAENQIVDLFYTDGDYFVELPLNHPIDISEHGIFVLEDLTMLAYVTRVLKEDDFK